MILGHTIFSHSNCISEKQVLDSQELITFDGVYESVWRNRELLRGKDVLLFVTGDYVGKDNTFDKDRHFTEKFCTWDQLSELEEMGCKLGWHSWSHRDLTTLTEDEIWKELDCPFDTDYFAYPHGKFDTAVMDLVRQYGYKEAFSVTDGDDTVLQRLRRYP